MPLHPQKIKFKILRNEKVAGTKESEEGRKGRRKEKKDQIYFKIDIYIFLNTSYIDQFLNNKNYPKLTQEQIENLNRSII